MDNNLSLPLPANDGQEDDPKLWAERRRQKRIVELNRCGDELTEELKAVPPQQLPPLVASQLRTAARTFRQLSSYMAAQLMDAAGCDRAADEHSASGSPVEVELVHRRGFTRAIVEVTRLLNQAESIAVRCSALLSSLVRSGYQPADLGMPFVRRLDFALPGSTGDDHSPSPPDYLSLWVLIWRGKPLLRGEPSVGLDQQDCGLATVEGLMMSAETCEFLADLFEISPTFDPQASAKPKLGPKQFDFGNGEIGDGFTKGELALLEVVLDAGRVGISVIDAVKKLNAASLGAVQATVGRVQKRMLGHDPRLTQYLETQNGKLVIIPTTPTKG